MKEVRISHFISWIFGIVVFTIGALNLFLVHPVPGIIFLLLSFIYFPPVNDLLRKRFGFSIPVVIKVIQGIVIIWFTLGVSDLGDAIASRGSRDLSDTKNKMDGAIGEIFFFDFFIEYMKY